MYLAVTGLRERYHSTFPISGPKAIYNPKVKRVFIEHQTILALSWAGRVWVVPVFTICSPLYYHPTEAEPEAAMKLIEAPI